jgi:preprotein translocase subunit SecF
MQFIKPDIDINFIGKRKIGFVLSLILIIISIGSLVINGGPKQGIDFAGGTLIQVKFKADTQPDDIKKGLGTIGMQKASVQQFGEIKLNEYLIRTEIPLLAAEGISKKLVAALAKATGQQVEIRRVETVGAQVGQDLREKALFAMFYALLFITIYISGRFEFKWLISGIMAAALMGAVYVASLLAVSVSVLMLVALVVTLFLFWLLKLRYAMGAIVALIHDVMITVGLFSIMGKEFTLPIIAALLTIIGYSLNDTIIVFDRIRENSRKHHKRPLEYVINRSVNETLSRTILTSVTTLIVLVSLFLLGGGIIHDFAFAMIAGVVIGTYSSVYVASPIILSLQGNQRK